MLIIAIPKSASTSLIDTLKRIHNISAKQDFTLEKLPFPSNSKIIHNYHSDVRDINDKLKEKFKSDDVIYKQHIFPSENNVNKLKDVKKVILLRNVNEVILAYRRGMIKGVHAKLEGFNVDMSESMWLRKASDCGLLDDLNLFTSEWTKYSKDGKSLVITYEDLLANPKQVINSVEAFFGLITTNTPVELSKSRYSRRNKLHIIFLKVVLKLNKMFGENT